MKSYLSVALFALVATLVIASEVHTEERCPPENCLSPNKCESGIVGVECPNQGDTCCSVVKTEFRMHCRHWGGECMNKCAGPLQRSTVDCGDNTVCCVLV